MTASWKIRGEPVLSCNCDVFCPCVVSLGRSEPTRSRYRDWGRNWDLSGRSGGYARVEWEGPRGGRR